MLLRLLYREGMLPVTTPATMTPENAAALRKPFDPSAVGKLPRLTCRDCSQSQRRRCDRHSWVTHCPDCQGSHSNAAIHLSYVGHAAATDRLLAVDPAWTWEPLAYGPDGLPALDRHGNLWIRLTVCGVTRLGYGDGSTSIKELIGDAIRNSAMRFGVALDLWAKEELEQSEHPTTPPAPAERPVERLTTAPADDPFYGKGEPLPMAAKTRARMFALFTERGITDEEAQRAGMGRVLGREVASRGDLTEGEAQAVIASLLAHPPAPDPDADYVAAVAAQDQEAAS